MDWLQNLEKFFEKNFGVLKRRRKLRFRYSLYGDRGGNV